MSAAAHQEPRYGLPYVAGCDECTRFEEGEAAAREELDRSKEADFRVMGRRHLRQVHGVKSVV